MMRPGLSALSVHALVDRFIAIVLAQDRALLYSELTEYNGLYRQMRAIEKELKARSGDQRRVLLSLFTHENAQVRLQAAGATLAVEPIAARRLMESIAVSRTYPQAGYAGMTLDALDRGSFNPT